ncbi:MAG: Y-family DNA polymerase [Ignavibacteria bacterium]|jgi:DNA polymerase V
MKKIFALVDCNNFYASCERVFRPDLEGVPIVILSNNDGCIISRSQEAKDMEIQMGAPYFKTPLPANVRVFSSNYGLYGDMSQRVMEILEEYTDGVEVYSIDEAFLDFTGLNHVDLTDYTISIKRKVGKGLGIPVSIGVGESKTLAKLANKAAKRDKKLNDVLNLVNYPQIDDLLKEITVGEVWGIGRRTAKKMSRYGIVNAKQLKYVDDKWALKKFTVTGLRTVWELRGTSCEYSDGIPEIKKGICNSRSFGRAVYSLDDLNEAVSDYVSTAAEKLRRQKSITKTLLVYLRSHNIEEHNYYSNWAKMKLPKATDDTLELIHYAKEGMKRIFKDGLKYKKAGVILTELIPMDEAPKEMFDNDDELKKKEKLMYALDKVNQKYGWKKLRVAAVGVKQDWWMKSEMRSPDYTTDWKQIPTVKAK